MNVVGLPQYFDLLVANKITTMAKLRRNHLIIQKLTSQRQSRWVFL